MISDLEITSNPRSDGIYRTGEEIEVTATFGAPVAVSGRPRIQLQLGQSNASQVWAEYERGGATVLPDGSERVLLRNNSGQVVDDPSLDNTTGKAAQAFTTGAESDGYRLDSIGFFFAHLDDDSTAAAHLTVTLNQDDNGDPGAVLCTLDDPTSFPSNALSVFDASPCDALAANTTYFVVLERVTVTADRISPALTLGGIVNAGTLDDWSMADSSHAYASGSWSETAERSYVIGITGAVVAPLLVSNTGQTATATGDSLTDTRIKLAKRFTTGAEANGYLLGSIAVRFHLISDTETAAGHLMATLNAVASNGDPGAALCTLKDPPRFSGAGVHRFAAGQCPALAPGTSYFVVIERLRYDATATIELSTADTSNEDSGAAAGWSLSTGRYFLSSGTVLWQNRASEPYQIEVHGVVAPADYSADQLVFTYTVQAADESDSDGVSIGVAGAANAIDPRVGSIRLAGTALDAVLDFGPTDSVSGQRVNWERPSLVDVVSAADGRRLHLTFSEALNPRSAPSNSHFTVMVDREPTPLRGATAAVAARVVTLTLATPIDSARRVLTVGYQRFGRRRRGRGRGPGGQRRDRLRRAGRTEPLRDQGRAVRPDSPLVPVGLEVGDQFRLLFLTSTTRDAISTDIETYNAFVQAAAGIGQRDIREYRTGFLAVASTALVDARNNTSTTGEGVPIYWLGGGKIADDYADFYDGTWADEANPTDETGAATDQRPGLDGQSRRRNEV